MLSFVNPFVPLDVENPSYAQKLQKPLKVTIFFTFKYDILFDKKYIKYALLFCVQGSVLPRPHKRG